MRLIPTVSIPDFSTAIRRAGAAEIERRANRYGKMLTDDLQGRVADIPRVGAASRKHGTPGSVHNVTFTHRVVGNAGTFPIYLTARANGNEGDLMKMWILNNGRKGGTIIRPINYKWLKFKWGTDDDATTYAKQVTQGATEPLEFIEKAVRALPIAIGRRFRR